MNHLHQYLRAPDPALEICVVVPAKNESSRLQRALSALARQKGLGGSPLSPERWEVILLINNSADHSLSIANDFLAAHPLFPLQIAELHLPPQLAHIGHVRKLLLDTAAERLLRNPKASSLMLSTDADTEVAPDWIAQNEAEIGAGAEAVGGRITLQQRDLQQLDQQTRKIHMESDRYNLLVSWLEHECDPQAHDPWPRHHQHFGSSFALKPGIYQQVGGLPECENLEDVALYELLIRYDVKFRHSPSVAVSTAGRLDGRAAVGLAEQLSRWREGPSCIPVPSVLLWETFYSFRAQLRALWRDVQSGRKVHPSAVADFAHACGASIEEVRQALNCKWFGMAFEALDVRTRLEGGSLSDVKWQSLNAATRELEEWFYARGLNRRQLCVGEDQSDIALL